MEVITLYQPYWRNSKKTGKKEITLKYVLPDGTLKAFGNTTEKTLTAMKQAVVNIFLKDGYKAPKNEIAKYISQNGYFKERRVGTYKYSGGSIDYLTKKEWVEGCKLVMMKD